MQVFGFLRQLTLPPKDVWKIDFTSEPFETLVQGHTYIARNYRFTSMLVGRESSLNTSQPILTRIGNTFLQNFIVPVDPEHLMQRTGYACSYISQTVNSENIIDTYDQFSRNCTKVLEEKVGSISLNITWKREDWDEDLADQYRYGDQTSEFADLKGVLSDLEDDINIGYKFIAENSCVLEEGGAGVYHGCVRGTGWRQLLKFSSVTVNVGRTDIKLGKISEDYIRRGVFEFDKCHQHYHFQHYANFTFGDIPARKTGFCLQSTWRYHNNEWTSFNTPFSSCDYQVNNS